MNQQKVIAALYVNGDNITCFNTFRLEYILKEIGKIAGKENIITAIFRIQAYSSIMWRYVCIGLIDFSVKGKILFGYTNLFSPKNMIGTIRWTRL